LKTWEIKVCLKPYFFANSVCVIFGLIWVAHSCAIANAILQSCVFSFLVLIILDVLVVNLSRQISTTNNGGGNTSAKKNSQNRQLDSKIFVK